MTKNIRNVKFSDTPQNQTEQILWLLKYAGKQSTLDMMREGVIDARKRISELRRLGYIITGEKVRKKNRWGRDVFFTLYFAKKRKKGAGNVKKRN